LVEQNALAYLRSEFFHENFAVQPKPDTGLTAHHSRLWNRNVVEEPKLPAQGEISALDVFHGNGHATLRTRPFLLLCICQHLRVVINPASSWGQRLNQLLTNEFPDLSHVGITLQGMGVDVGWAKRDW
jgi:abortive infection bacteriophage resistance protein